jgi:hypothetical protein
MNTLGWGPPGWDFLFLTAIDAFERINDSTGNVIFFDYKDIYVNFFTQIVARVLPCIHCRNAWGSFNDPNNRQCVNGCWGSILSFFLQQVKQCDKNDNVLVLWLYIMKNKVTKKLSLQEDEEMQKALLTMTRLTRPEDLASFRGKDELEQKINKKMNIKRIDRTKVSHPIIYKKYADRYHVELENPTYFPFLFAVAFNAGWSNEGTTGIRRIRIDTIRNDYIQFFNCLELIAPCRYIREAIKKNPVVSAFSSPDTNIDDNRLARWLHAVFMDANVVKPQQLPKDFTDVVKRYTRWRVSCSSSDTALKTCRSSTPNRYAPLLPDHIYESTANKNVL